MTKRNSGDLNNELSINCTDDAKDTGAGGGGAGAGSQHKTSPPGSVAAKSPVMNSSNFSSSMSNGSVDDEDSSSKENCDTTSGQHSDGGAGSNALLSVDGNKSKKKGKCLCVALMMFCLVCFGPSDETRNYRLHIVDDISPWVLFFV